MHKNDADEIKKIFLNKGKGTLFNEYEKIFSDDKNVIKFSDFNDYIRKLRNYNGDLNSKILKMLNDDKNGGKYFNNLVCILELLDFLSKQSDSSDYNFCMDHIKQSNKVELIEAIKNFMPTENNHMVVLEDENSNRFETPGIQICASFFVFEDETSILSCSPDNTCKSNAVYTSQYDAKTLVLYSSQEKFLSSLQYMVYQKKWECALNDIDIANNDIEHLISNVRSDLYNKARILTEHDKNEIQFFSMAVRGKGNRDRNGIDNEKHDLFSLFNKKLPFFGKCLSRYSIGKDYYPAINYLFYKVSCDSVDQNLEGYDSERSLLNEHGKKITERILKLFLDENEYNVIKEYGNIRVEQNICVDKDFISENERILTYIMKINSEKSKELEVYSNKFIDKLEEIIRAHPDSIFRLSEKYNAKNNEPKIDREIDTIVNNICDRARDKIDFYDPDSFVFLVKTAVKKRFRAYFSGIKGSDREEQSAIDYIENEYNNHRDDFFLSIKKHKD